MTRQPFRIFLAPDIGIIDRLKYIASLFLLSTTFGELGLNRVLSKSSSERKGLYQCRYLRVCVGEAGFDRLIARGWIKGSSPLDIDNHIIPFAYFFLISLVATIRTATMLIGGHDDLATEGFNRILYPDIVGSYATESKTSFTCSYTRCIMGFPFISANGFPENG